MSAQLSVAAKAVNQSVNTSVKLYIPIQLNDNITYNYTYSNTLPATIVNSSANNSILVNSLQLSYALPTTYYQMFLFVTDMLNTPLNGEINNSNVTGYCNNVSMAIGNGYFKSPTCTSNLTIFNSFTNVTLY
jgi:hypothetical protein